MLDTVDADFIQLIKQNGQLFMILRRETGIGEDSP